MSSNLVGTYKLATHGIYDKEGTFTSSSDYLAGELHYGEDGSLTVMILFREKPTALEHILSYVGKFKVISDDEVEHQITLSSSVKLINKTELRKYIKTDTLLKLEKEMPDQKRFEAVWKRIPPKP